MKYCWWTPKPELSISEGALIANRLVGEGVPVLGSLEFSHVLQDACLEGKPVANLEEVNKIDYIAKELLD